MYVYTEKDLENIRKEVLEDVQDITSLAVNMFFNSGPNFNNRCHN